MSQHSEHTQLNSESVAASPQRGHRVPGRVSLQQSEREHMYQEKNRFIRPVISGMDPTAQQGRARASQPAEENIRTREYYRGHYEINYAYVIYIFTASLSTILIYSRPWSLRAANSDTISGAPHPYRGLGPAAGPDPADLRVVAVSISESRLRVRPFRRRRPPPSLKSGWLGDEACGLLQPSGSAISRNKPQ